MEPNNIQCPICGKELKKKKSFIYGFIYNNRYNIFINIPQYYCQDHSDKIRVLENNYILELGECMDFITITKQSIYRN